MRNARRRGLRLAALLALAGGAALAACARPTGLTHEEAKALIARGVPDPGTVDRFLIDAGSGAGDSIFVLLTEDTVESDQLLETLARRNVRVAVYGPVPAKNQHVVRNALERLADGRARGSELIWIGPIVDRPGLEERAQKAGVVFTVLER
jgi:hypothetical protein